MGDWRKKAKCVVFPGLGPVAIGPDRCYNWENIHRKGGCIMKYLSQFLIILGFSLVGECLQRLIPIPVPASVYGIVLLFAALCLGLVKVEQVRETGSFLSSILPILFVPPVVGILENWVLIRGSVPAIFLLAAGSTVLTFGLSGAVAQKFCKKEEKKDA